MERLTPPKSPMVCEKHQRGCMWRLYGLFDFRQGGSAKKLISDKKHSNRFDRKISKMKLDLLTDLDETSESIDVTHDKMMKKASRNSQSLLRKGLKGEAENEKSSYSVTLENSSDKFNSETLAEEEHGKKRSACGCKSIDHEITAPQAHEKSAEAIINQKFIDEKYIRANGVNCQSRQLSDALEILNSNKEFFLKLLQDPNSLLAKRIEDIRESQAVKHWMKSPSDGNFSAPRQCDVHADTRTLKSCDTIVVLKPGPTSMRNAQGNTSFCLRNNRQKEMHAGNFSFSRIKKKLGHAIGVSRKERYSKSVDTALHRSPCEGVKEVCEQKGVKFIRRNSRGGGITISPLDIKKRDNISWGSEFGSDIQCENASTSGSSLENSSISEFSEISLEAMLLELLTNGNKDRRHEMQDQKILEGMASFPEYDFLPTRSPVGLSPYSDCQLLYEDKWRLQKEQISCLSPTANNRQSAKNKHIMYQGETNSIEESACRYGTNASETFDCIEKTSIVDTDDTVYQGETDPAVTLSELNCEEKANIYEEDEYLKTFIQDQLSTSSPDIFQSPPRIERVEDSASIEEKGEHPSPISVLEPFFVDFLSEHGEEHHSAHLTSTSSLNEHEIIEYIQSVLQAASLDWDEISMMRDASDQLLDPFLLDTVKLHGNQLHGDYCILLFECIDEVLVDVCCSDIRHSPWLSFIKPTLRQLPLEENVIGKVLKYVEWHNSTPRTMQQVVEKDIATPCVTWLDIRKDAEEVVFQIVEDVLEEMIIETIVQLQLLHIFMAKFICCDFDNKIQLQLCNYTLESLN